MRKEYKYKLQGNGKHSWRCDEFEGDVMVSSYMIYKGDEIYLKVYETLLGLGLIPNV